MSVTGVANWPAIGPIAALSWLRLDEEAPWPDIVRSTYERFEDHWAAGVAFHR